MEESIIRPMALFVMGLIYGWTLGQPNKTFTIIRGDLWDLVYIAATRLRRPHILGWPRQAWGRIVYPETIIPSVRDYSIRELREVFTFPEEDFAITFRPQSEESLKLLELHFKVALGRLDEDIPINKFVQDIRCLVNAWLEANPETRLEILNLCRMSNVLISSLLYEDTQVN